MTRISLLALVAALGACATQNDMTAQQTESTAVATGNPNGGQVTVAGVDQARVFDAIDTRQLVKQPSVANGGETSSSAPAPTADPGIAVVGAQPSAVLAAIDPRKLVGADGVAEPGSSDSYIAPEVQAVVDSGKRYTTRDLAAAQLKAVTPEG